MLGAIHSTKIQTGPTGKRGPPQKVDLFFRNFSGWTEPIHWVLDRNFRKFWLNGSRPLSCLLVAARDLSEKQLISWIVPSDCHASLFELSFFISLCLEDWSQQRQALQVQECTNIHKYQFEHGSVRKHISRTCTWATLGFYAKVQSPSLILTCHD